MSRCLWSFASIVAAAAFGLHPNAAAAQDPEQLSAQVVGVVGSGPLLSLALRSGAGQPVRILSQGDLYADGWALTALTPSVATLSKGAESRQIGLNPTGALDQAAAGPPSQVNVAVSPADRARLKDEGWDGTPAPGLTQEETERSLLYSLKIEEAISAFRTAAGGVTSRGLGDEDFKAVLGDAAWDDRQALMRKVLIAQRQAALDRGDINRVRVMDGLAAVGPDSFRAPAGTTIEAAARAAGLISTAGYSSRLEADGGHTMTKLPGAGRSTIPDATLP